ncbi:MAG: hypothetical protein ACI84O_000892 [Myxococcota bacterium]|jgi:hypothetical protein
MLFISTLIFAASLQVSLPDSEIAVTQSGVAIEASNCKVGDLELDTPYGRFLCAADPVVEIRDLNASWQQLSKLKERGVFSNSEWLETLSKAGLLSALLQETDSLSKTFPELTLGYDLIQSWAEQTSHLPISIELSKQVPWLHAQYLKQKKLSRLIYGTELTSIVSASADKRAERNLTYSQVGDELKSSDPLRRRIGLLLCIKQSEMMHLATILTMSITDDEAQVRLSAGRACAALYQYAARQYWVKLAARGSEIQRSKAVEALARHGGPIGMRALLLLDSASQHSIGDRYTFKDNRVWIVKKRLSNLLDPRLWADDHFDPRVILDVDHYRYHDIEFIDAGSVFVITKVPTLLAEQIRALL